MCLTGSQDCTVIGWSVKGEGSSVTARYVYKGHTASVESVAVSPDGQRVGALSLGMTFHG